VRQHWQLISINREGLSHSGCFAGQCESDVMKFLWGRNLSNKMGFEKLNGEFFAMKGKKQTKAFAI
jgi:hypothetical protein